jgi:glycosyltransferase involved in cell wall biosynthesis
MNSLAIAMPIFNEADGIQRTLNDLDAALSNKNESPVIFIQDDCSTDNTRELVIECSKGLKSVVKLEMNKKNQGHGPTVLRAYERAAESGALVVMQLDSDGQFDPSELISLIEAVRSDADIAIGLRKGRSDPWYRKILTFSLKTFLTIRYFRSFKDPNSPVRAFKNEILRNLLKQIPNSALIPNIYLVVIAKQQNLSFEEIPISHRVRNGDEKTGSTWASKSKVKSILRLLKFSLRAFQELISFKI